jgi:type I restriction enzyme S subunit
VSERTTLAELADRGALYVNDGYRTKASELGDEGLPVLRVAEVRDGFIRPEFKDRVRQEFRPKMSGKTSRPHDVLITTKGTVGRAAIVPASLPELVYSPQLCVLRVLDDQVISPRWLYAWVRSPAFQRQASVVAGQTDMAPYINLVDLRRMVVELPSLSEQHAVAEVLGALDDKLAANAGLVSVIRQMLAALYEKLADAADAASWQTSTLGEQLDVLETGKRPPGGVAQYSAGVPSLGAESVSALAAYDYSKTKFVPVEFFQTMKRGIVEDLDVLLYKDGGRPGEFEPHVSLLGKGFPFERFCINEHVYRLRARPPLTQEYLYCWLSSEPTMEEMRRRGTGVAIPGLNSTAVKGLPMVVPPTDLLTTFSGRAAPLVELALKQARESRVLAQLRDALLPPLISGELRVRDAESWVSESV